jgi:hypothetical protein
MRYPGYDALLPKAEQEALEASIRRRAEAEERAANEEPVKERDAGTGDRTYLLATIDELRASVPVLETPPPRCPHNRVEMLAHQDDIPPDGPCLVWSPICRDCGDDVPMAAPPVGPQPKGN